MRRIVQKCTIDELSCAKPFKGNNADSLPKFLTEATHFCYKSRCLRNLVIDTLKFKKLVELQEKS